MSIKIHIEIEGTDDYDWSKLIRAVEARLQLYAGDEGEGQPAQIAYVDEDKEYELQRKGNGQET